MSRIQRGTGIRNNDLSWWDILQNIINGRSWNDDGSLRLTPEDFEMMRRDDLNSTVSGSLASSELAQKYGLDNLRFYEVNAINKASPVSNNRIAVIVRKYNDGQVGLLFYDYGTNKIVMPGNIEFNSNIEPSQRQQGEFVIRNGGPVSGNDPLYGDLTIDRAMHILTSSSNITTPAPSPGPTPPEPELKKFNMTINKGQTKIKAYRWDGTQSIEVNQFVIRFEEQPDGSYEIYSTPVGSTERLWINADRVGTTPLTRLSNGNWKIPAGDLPENATMQDVGNFFFNNFKNDPTPEPGPGPEPEPGNYEADTEGYSLLFTDSGGNRYRGQINIQYQFVSGQWRFKILKSGTNEALTITGSDVNIVGRTDDGPIYEIQYSDGLDFGSSFDENYDGIPPPDPEPEPLGPNEHKLNVNDPSTSQWKFLRLLNIDGTPYTGAYIIDYTQGRRSGRASNIQFYYLDSSGNKINLSANFGDVDGIEENSIFDSNGNVIGKKYNIETGMQGLEAWMTENYENNNRYPEPPPEPPQPGPPAPPQPPAPPGTITTAQDRKVGRINTMDHPGIDFFGADGRKLEDENVELFFNGDTDGDGKNEIYFLTVEGEPVSISKVEGYDYEDFPEPDTTGTGRRRLPGGDLVLYDIEAGVDELDDLFQNGFGAREREDSKELNLLESLPIKAFVLYNRKDTGPKIENKDNRFEHLWITGIIKHNIQGQPEFFDLSYLDEEKKNGIIQSEGAGEEFRGTFTSEGGERAQERFDLMAPPDLCGGTRGTGRRLNACGPNEPAPEYNEHKNKVSEMELLNFERNRFEQDERDAPDYTKTQFERMRETPNERELVSMYGTFSSSSYIPEDKRPESLFGLDYDKEHSTHNMATYIGRANKNGIISIRGTKPGNVVDLVSDALILTGYEDKLSIRFEQSLRDVKAIMDAHPRTKFTLSSHSLGGAINEFIINELRGTKYQNRLKAISFNPGKAPNVKTERAEQISDLITDASVLKAMKEQDPRFLPIMGSIQTRLGITAEQITNPDIMTSEAEMANIIENYPALTESFQGLMGRIGGLGTVEERVAEAEMWIQENETLLSGINYTASLMNIIKVKMMFDLMLKFFDFTANYTIDSFLERESEMDKKLNTSVKPYDVLWSEGDNVIFKYKQDPISLHHSFLEDEKQNVRTYKGDEKSILWEGLDGRMSQGLKEHGMDNFLIDDHKDLLDHSETWGEYFQNLLNDNSESFSETINGIRTKLDEKSKEFIRENGWANFLGLF